MIRVDDKYLKKSPHPSSPPTDHYADLYSPFDSLTELPKDPPSTAAAAAAAAAAAEATVVGTGVATGVHQKSYTKFNDCLGQKVKVKSKFKQAESGYKSRDGHFNLRVGCDICCKGNSFKIKTNYPKLRKKKEFFLNDVSIAHGSDYHDLDPVYECSDKTYLQMLLDVYKQMDRSNHPFFNDRYVYDSEMKFYKSTKSGSITSKFFRDINFDHKEMYKDVKDIGSVTICYSCFSWLKLCEPSIDQKAFRKQHPLYIFWRDFYSEIRWDIVFFDEYERKIIEQQFYD